MFFFFFKIKVTALFRQCVVVEGFELARASVTLAISLSFFLLISPFFFKRPSRYKHARARGCEHNPMQKKQKAPSPMCGGAPRLARYPYRF